MSTSRQRLSPREPDPQEQAALAWIACLDRGLTSAEEVEFERWLAVDPRHARLLAEFEGTWTLLDRMQDLPAVSLRADAARQPLRAQRSPGSSRRRGLLAGAAAAVLLLGGLLLRERPAPVDAGRTVDFALSTATQIGELRTVPLPDGSTVRLNTSSSVDVRFEAAARTVRLTQGEAHFVVAHDPARPFTVVAAGVAVRAVGTAFNVRVHPDTVEVLVTAGLVAVAESRQPSPTPLRAAAAVPVAPRTLAAGQSLALPREDRASTASSTPPSATVLTPGEVERALAWQARRLEFASASLAEMVAEFNRYNRHRLVIEDPELEAQRFGGTFRLDDPLGFARVLEANFLVSVETRDQETRLRVRR